MATFAALNKTLLQGRQQCKVLVLDNLITSSRLGSDRDHEGGKIRFIQHDVIKPFRVEEPLDFILHAAGIASPFYYRAYPLETMDVAISGTRQVLDLARQHRAKLLFFSSSEIYGDPDASHVPTNEEYRGNVSCLGPRACYDESKRVGETLCRIYATQYGVETKIVRPFNVYGPGMQEKDYRVLPNFASRIVAGKPLAVYGHGEQTRTFCYITDAINGFLRVLLYGKSGEPYNIGNPTPEISMLSLASMIGKLVPGGVEIQQVDYPSSYPADEPNRRCPNIAKASRDVGYSATLELTVGLQRFLTWAILTYPQIARSLEHHDQTRTSRSGALGQPTY